MIEELDNKSIEEGRLEWKNSCLKMCRTERDRLLSETDWIHLPDVTVTEEYKTAMNTYRQELRDFPATFTTLFDSWDWEDDIDKIYGVTPASFNFPTKPEQ